MTKTNASVTSLASLTMDQSVHPVLDELTALSRLRPTAPTPEESYALMMHQTPVLAGIAARGRYHAGEVERFLACAAQTRQLRPIHDRLPVMFAMTLLNHASAIAIALLPSTGPSDEGVHAAAGQAVLRAALDNGHKEQLSTIRAAFGLIDQPALAIAEGAHAIGDPAGGAAEGDDSLVSADGPTVHRIEQTASLSAFLKQSHDLEGLLAEAREHLDHADRLAAGLEDGELPIADRDRLERAQACAHMLGVAALARIGLAPVRLDDSRAVRIETAALIKSSRLPARLKAIATLASWMGSDVRSQLSGFESHGGKL